MRSTLLWTDQIKDKDGTQVCVYDLAFSPDGEQLIAAADTKIYVYNVNDGTLIQALKGHKENVLCVAYSKDGKRFASGSADKQVIIWTAKLEGILKYSHNDAVRCIQYNPLSHQLASCTASDFGLWSPEQKAVTKQKVPSQVNSCSWSSDGHHLALALSAGYISVRNRNGEEKNRIERLGGPLAAIWGISFSPIKEDDSDIIITVDWTQSLSFYDLNGKQIGKERNLGFDPLCVTHFSSGEFILLSGSNKKSLLYTKDGISIGTVAEQNSWIWSCKSSSDGNRVVVGCQDGTVAVYDLTFSTVHSLYKERYAYRENMTDVIIQHLIKEEKVRIKCRDLVKKLAIYKNRLAIQLQERVIIYELTKGSDATDMHYKVKEKINNKLDCTLMVVCADNIILCQEKRLQCLSFHGTIEKEWIMDSSIRYIRATGGPPQKEGLLVGLKNGQIVQIFINNPFPINIIKISNPIRCLDISMLRQKLAVVDDKGVCSVYEIKTKQLLYQESNANSVSWNTQYEDMLSFSGSGVLSIKASTFPVHRQNLQGFVVGFCGAKVFCLQLNSVTTVEVSQSAPMYQFIENKLFFDAYKTACLKVTDTDWEILAHSALDNMNLDIARKAFIKTKNWIYLELIQSYILTTTMQNKSTEMSLLGDVMAYRGYFAEAAKLYRQASNESKAVSMYSDLRMFEQANEFVNNSDLQNKMQLTKKKTDWINNSNDPKSAAEMYLSVGDTAKAIEIIAQHGWVDMMMTVVRQLDKGDRITLSLCADYLVKSKHYFNAAEVYKKIGDLENLAMIYIKSCQWQEAFKLANDYTHLKEDVYVPYALWLAENDRFVEAQRAFHNAGKVEEALLVLQQLINNAINENRYNDASYYCWTLSLQCLDLVKDAPENDQLLKRYRELTTKADIYYAYQNVYRYIEEPFTSLFPDALFNMARYLFHAINDETPKGVSKVVVLFALAKQGRNLGAYKLVRHVYEKLHTMLIPPRFQDAIEIGDLTIRAKPFSDAEDLLSLCYRCSTTNPLYNKLGNQCINCNQPFVYSYATFDILPLVEFRLEDGITDEEAISLLKQKPSTESVNRFGQTPYTPSAPQWEEEVSTNYQSLKLDYDYNNINNEYDYDMEDNSIDPFTRNLMAYQEGNGEFTPVIVNRAMLLQMNLSDVIIVDWPSPLSKQYYRNIMPDMLITKCWSCNKFFHSDEYEMQVLQRGHCPYCRCSAQRSAGH